MCTNGALEEVKLYFDRKAKLLMQFIVHPEIFEQRPANIFCPAIKRFSGQ
jgi:hypothetical protein